MIIFITIFTTLFFLIILYSFYYFLKLYYQKSEEFLIELAEINCEHESVILSTQVEIQEQTFENISRDIHDNIGQKLSLAKLHLSTLALDLNNNNKEKVIIALNLIATTIIDLGDISRSMSADFLQNNGLVEAIKFEINQLQKLNKYDVSFSHSGEGSFLNDKQELIIFRIVQEAINNIIKHSQCTQIIISLNFKVTEVVMTITDDGVGFDYEQKLKSKGNGLGNMKKRAHKINAKLEVETSLLNGSKILMIIPYDKQP